MAPSRNTLFIEHRPSLVLRNLPSRVCGLLLVPLLVGIRGCGSVLQVRRAKSATSPVESLDDCQDKVGPCILPGLPFYAVGYRCLHTTVWLNRFTP